MCHICVFVFNCLEFDESYGLENKTCTFQHVCGTILRILKKRAKGHVEWDINRSYYV